MFATIISIFLSIFILFNPIHTDSTIFLTETGLGLLIIATALLFLQAIAYTVSWTPLLKSEQNFTPHILGMWRKDRHIQYVWGWLVLFVFITIAIVYDLWYSNFFNKNVLLAIWVVFLGISFDVFHHFLRRITAYLNPFETVKILFEEGRRCIKNDDDVALCDWDDALTEIGVKAVQRSSPSLANDSVNYIQKLTENYLESSKSIAHDETDSKVGYTLFYIFQRLEFLFDRALKANLEPTCSHIITALGKIVVYCAKYDMTMTVHPLYVYGKLVKKAQDHGMQDLPVKATITLLEVSKLILSEVDITYANLQETFFSIIRHLEEIAQETFRHDKSVSIKLLTQPFLDLKALFSSEKMAQHQDSSVILLDIGRVLNEFATLELVMKTMPPIPQVEEPPAESQGDVSPPEKPEA